MKIEQEISPLVLKEIVKKIELAQTDMLAAYYFFSIESKTAHEYAEKSDRAFNKIINDIKKMLI